MATFTIEQHEIHLERHQMHIQATREFLSKQQEILDEQIDYTERLRHQIEQAKKSGVEGFDADRFLKNEQVAD